MSDETLLTAMIVFTALVLLWLFGVPQGVWLG